MAQQERFDWWAAEPAGRTATTPAGRAGARTAAPAVARQGTAVGEAPAAVPVGPPAPAAGPHAGVEAGQVYRAVQQSPAFREIRRSYRGFAFPATGLFLGWYLLYVLAQAAAPS